MATAGMNRPLGIGCQVVGHRLLDEGRLRIAIWQHGTQRNVLYDLSAMERSSTLASQPRCYKRQPMHRLKRSQVRKEQSLRRRRLISFIALPTWVVSRSSDMSVSVMVSKSRS